MAHQWWRACCGCTGIGIQYSKPQVQASAVVSCRLSRKLATMPERMIEAGHANAAQNHAGGAPLVGAAGQGMNSACANAVAIGSNPVRRTPHGIIAAFARITAGTTNERAKNHI